MPSALTLLTTVTREGAARRRAIAAWSAAGAAAGASGFVIGGIVTDLASWRLIFWACLPLAAVLAVVIAVSVPPDLDTDPGRSLNLAGSAVLTAAVMAFVVGLTVIARPAGYVAGGVLLGGCAVLAWSFVLIDRRAAAPLLPPALLGVRQLRQGALGGFLSTATTTSAMTLVALYLQDTLGRSPLEAATALLPLSLAVIAGSSLSAALQRRLRPAGVIAGGLAVIALADLALIPSVASLQAVALCAAGAGAGIGLSSAAATGLGIDVGLRWRGTASGVINTAAQLGTAAGVAVLLLVAAATTGVPAQGTGPPLAAWATGAAVAAAGAIRFAVTADRRRTGRKTAPDKGSTSGGPGGHAR